ncbi:solute carrier organic anion transporter family member 1B2 isoform X2 [Nilaparvata lugens]|uniref:solute carrier organic anion transporter family member 1B2 isoform X2 n=1 Tax=Nilaparvata lugens TaxID=108931 RepID=UPI00193D4911|nr:solute carrier organic anion transporter family member 1B2 isoform X2 [Nilaparvata lugens]
MKNIVPVIGMVSGSFDTTTGVLDCGYICNGYVLCSRFGRFAKPRLFFIIFILLGVVHGAVETILTKTILSSDPVIPYRITKWIVVGSEVLQVVCALPIVFWGSRKRRPQWLAACTGALAAAGFLFASYLLSEYSADSKRSQYRTQKDTLLCNIWLDNIILKKWSWYWLTVLALFLLHFATGISRIAYWSLGIAYVDDNSLPRSSPFAIGFILAIKQFGAFTGLFISYFSTTNFYNGFCWLGVSIVVLIVAFLIGMFPTKMIDNEFRNASYSDEDTGYFASLKRIFTNKVIILNGSAMILVLTVVVNASAIEDEYIESVFYVPSSYYSLFNSILSWRYLFSILKPSVAAFAMLISGWLIHRIRPRSTILCIWSVMCLCVAAASMFSLIFLRCSGTPIHHEDSRKDLLEYCNKDCDCNQVPFTPVCSEYDQFVFYSPCHAGCSSSQGTGQHRVFLDCQCVSSHSVRGGHCTRGKCSIFYYIYQIMTLIITAAISSGFIGCLVVCLRGVLPTDKSSAIGVIAIISGFAARAPFKFLYDFVTNFGCIYLVGDLCKMYNSEKLTTYFHLLNICLLLIAAGILSLMCFLVEDIALYESVITRASRNKQNVSEPDADGREMTDFRSQLNQALKNRREVAAEEQQLLGERRSSMSSKQFSENDPAPANDQPPQQLQQHQRASQGVENGRNSFILNDETPNSLDKLRPSTSNQSSNNRDSRPKVLPKPIILSKPSTSTFKAQNLPSTSSNGLSPSPTPHPTDVKPERCLTTPL